MAKSKKKWILFSLLVVVAVFAALPLVVPEIETKAMDAMARKKYGGTFINLPDGVVRIQWKGPKNGPVVVLVHGMGSSYYVWEPVFHALAEKGFRVLRYDLYGRGFSDRPDIKYNQALYERQLLGVLKASKIQGPVSLVGLSMGGGIVAHVTSRHPKKIKRVALLAPIGTPVKHQWLLHVLLSPGVGDYIMGAFGTFVIKRSFLRSFSVMKPPQKMKKNFHLQMTYKGYRRAILSSLRNMPISSMENTYRNIAKNKTPALLVWGKKDKLTPYKRHHSLKQWIPSLRFLSIPNAGHVLPWEATKPLLVQLVPFLRESATKKAKPLPLK